MRNKNDWEDLLAGWGTVLTRPNVLSKLPRCYERTLEVKKIVEKLIHGDSKAIVLDGPSGVGKTAMVYEVAHELAANGWDLIEVRPADLLVGTKWLGEWQTRISSLVESLSQPSQYVVYIPNIDRLDHIGRSSDSDSNAAEFLAPPISRGELAVIGEASSNRTGSDYGLEKIFERMIILPMDEEQSLKVAKAVCQEESFYLSEDAGDRLMEFAEYCGTQTELPGRALTLLRNVFERHQEKDHIVTQADLLQAVSDHTGMRTQLLDDSLPLTRSSVREFFVSKVLGQSEAIETATDVVMMIKAGLTDPKKPFNTMLFIGPTGVGKTEMARAIAEYCLGDANRLVRLDMSEYMTPDSIHKFLGSQKFPGALTTPVRERPFSIVLLDEFEKATFGIFDLCLQLFDAGRLTDFSNQTVNFCRTIIILTSNLGSHIDQTPPTAGLGFGVSEPKAEKQQLKTRIAAQQAMAQFFRPEFLNRLDRVVHFVPLDPDTIGSIASKELDAALDRSGIKRRKIKIQFDPAIVTLLIEKGYSPAFGARPLKRAIEKMVLIPLAREIAAGKLPIGCTILLGLQNGKIRSKVIHLSEEQGHATTQGSSGKKPSALVIKSIKELGDQANGLEKTIKSIRDQRTHLLDAINNSNASSREQRQSSYDQIYRLDAILSRYERFTKTIERFSEIGTTKSIVSHTIAPQEVLSGLMIQARIIEKLATESDLKDNADLVLSIRMVHTEGSRLWMVEKMAKMYQSFLARLDFSTSVLDDQQQEKPILDKVSLLVSGPGAFMVLNQEHGTHLFRKTFEGTKQLEAISVDVTPLTSSASGTFIKETEFKFAKSKGGAKRIVNRRLSVSAVHKPTKTSLNVVLDSVPESAKGLMLPWLAALAELQRNEGGDPSKQSTDKIVRRYDLGNRSVIRDMQTGQRWGHVDKAFNGELERFLPWMHDG